MSNRRYPPAYLRYFRARLLNLGRPSFWVTGIFLAVLGVLVQAHWTNPDIFTQQRNKVTESDALGSSLSAEDRAIAADIDNLSLLLDNSQLINLPVTTTNSQENNSKKLSPSFSKKPQSASTQPSTSVSQKINPVISPQNNIFVTQAQNLLRFGATDNSQLLGIQPFNPASQPTNNTVTSAGVTTELQTLSNTNQNSSSINPPATGLNQPTSSFNQTNSSASNSVNNSSYTGVLQTAPLNISPMPTFSPSTVINSRPTDIPQNTPSLPPNTNTNSHNLQTFSPSTVINSRPADIPQNTPNLPTNTYTNYNNLQTVPNQVQYTSPVLNRIAPILSRYNNRNSSSQIVTPITPGVSNNYNNSTWQQPNQYPQSNFPYSP